MKQALLVGNGVTSQLIHNYQDNEMMAKLDKINPQLINTINEKFNIFRKVYKNDDSDKERIIELIKSIPLFAHTSAAQIYQKYFEDYGLKYALGLKRLSGIETLLKVVKLFEMAIQADLIEVANTICFNNGLNGFDAVEIDIQRDVFTNFINSFSCVFTTNYDYLLDDIYDNEVFHLHGGFNYIKTRDKCGAINITRDKSVRKVDKPFLAWGIDGYEKLNSTKGGITFPITFPMYFGNSVINEYFIALSTGQYEAIHIWGYSGQNDKHINDNIKKNQHIKTIYYYCDPDKVDDRQYKQNVTSLFVSGGKNFSLRPWNTIWARAGICE